MSFNEFIDTSGMLSSATKSGDISAVRLALSFGPDANALRAAMMNACVYGHVDIARELINAGADQEARDIALDTLIASGWPIKADIVRLLLNAGTSANSRSWALLMFCKGGNAGADIIRELIAAGTDVNMRMFLPESDMADFSSDDPGYEDLVKQLIADTSRHPGFAALPYKEQRRIAEESIKESFAETQNRENGKTALMYACEHGREDIVALLINAGADVNARSNSGCTALMIACAKGNAGIVRKLINADADIAARDNNGYTALDFAPHDSHIATILRQASAW